MLRKHSSCGVACFFAGALLFLGSPGRLQAAYIHPAYTAPTTLGISGYVFLDLNQDGLYQQNSDWGINGAQVRLINDSTGDTVATTTTKTNGGYSFTGLSPGTYSLVEFTPPSFAATQPTTSLGTSYSAYGAAFLNTSGGTIATGTGSGQVNPSWYGTISSGTYSATVSGSTQNVAYTQVATVTSPAATWFGLPGTSGSPTYAVTGYNFGDYKSNAITPGDYFNPYHSISVTPYAIPTTNPTTGTAVILPAWAADVQTASVGGKPNGWVGELDVWGTAITVLRGDGNGTTVTSAEISTGATTPDFLGTSARIRCRFYRQQHGLDHHGLAQSGDQRKPGIDELGPVSAGRLSRQRRVVGRFDQRRPRPANELRRVADKHGGGDRRRGPRG